ncbi:MAG: hypothetical protein Q8S04_01770, partial [Bacteroidales bacterium]|nr:hypothetical protein [Bacteroidales bacterium]
DPKQAANQNQTTEQKSAQSSKFKIVVSGFEGLKKAAGEAVRLIKGASEVPAKEREFVKDKKLNTVSYKNGNTTIYLIPVNYEARAENHSYFKIY